MRMTGTQFTRKLWRQVALASSAALYLVLILAVTAFASNVIISDQAGVLNQSQIRKAASSLRYPVAVYTVNGFSGSTQQFNQRATNTLNNHPNMIVIAIDTSKRYLFVTRGRDVPLTSTDTADARQAFASGFNGGDYTGATVSSLNSLQNSLAAQTTTSGGNTNNGNGFGVGGCLVGLLILGGLIFLVMRRKRAAGLAGGAGLGSGIGGLFNRQRATNTNYGQPYQSNYPPDGPNYSQPHQSNYPPDGSSYGQPQNAYPPNNNPGYGPGYGPGYPPQQQGKGVNPLAAGGLGAAAGGLLGYELGKNQGGERDRQGENFGNSGDQSNSDVAAGSGGFFGNSEDSGNTNNDSLGGGDSGGGSGGFFGGNEDSGSGSGGFFGGSGGDSDSGSGGFFGGNEDSGSGSGGNF